MAKSRPSDKYWDDRAIARIEFAEKNIEPSLSELDRIYRLAQADITKQVNQIYKTYAKGQGLDFDKLLEKMSIEETHKFWLGMRNKGGNLEYIKSNYASRISRLEAIKGEIYSTVKDIETAEIAVHNGQHPKTINTAYNSHIYDVSKGLGVDIQFGGLNQAVLDAVLKDPWLGGNYSTRVWGNTTRMAVDMKELIGASLLSGKPPLTLTNQLVEKFAVSAGQAKRLLRTETNYFQNEADAISADDIGLDRYKYLATLDLRTSQTCRLHDDKVYKYADRKVGINYPPLHPNCRSTTRSYIGEDYEPKERRARDLTTGKSVLVPNQSYEKWASANDVLDPPKTKPQKPTAPQKPKSGVVVDKPIKNGVVGDVRVTQIPITPTYRRVDPAVQAVFNEGVADVHAKYPQAFQGLTAIEGKMTNAKNNRNAGVLTHGAYIKNPTRVYDPITREPMRDENRRQIFKADVGAVHRLGLTINGHQNSVEAQATLHKHTHEKGWWSIDNPKGTVYHELGHSLEVAMNVKANDLYKDIAFLNKSGGDQVILTDELKSSARKVSSGMSSSRIGDELVRDSIDELKTGDSYHRAIKTNVSEYANEGKRGYREAFAELFAKVMNEGTDAITIAFKKRLDAKLKELEL